MAEVMDAGDRQLPVKGKQIVTFDGDIFRQKGGLYPDYTDAKGKPIPWPGGEWKDGKEGRWFHRRLVQREDKFNRWTWLWLRVRMELQGIKLFLLAILRRRIQ